jgi:hypothetical protein
MDNEMGLGSGSHGHRSLDIECQVGEKDDNQDDDYTKYEDSNGNKDNDIDGKDDVNDQDDDYDIKYEDSNKDIGGYDGDTSSDKDFVDVNEGGSINPTKYAYPSPDRCVKI